MQISLNGLQPYLASALPAEQTPQHISSVNNEKTDSSVIQLQEFVKDIALELTSSKNVLRMDNIERILDKYGFNDKNKSLTQDNIQVLLSKIASEQQRETGIAGAASYGTMMDVVSEHLTAINSEIRNQSLYRRAASAEFVASTKMLEKEFPSMEDITTGTSFAEIWLRMAIFIGQVKEDYVDFYAGLMQKYTEMYESFNTNVQKASSDAVSTGDDGNNIAFDTNTMQAGYDAFENDVNRMNSELGSVDGWNKMSSDDQKKMALTLEPAFKVDNAGKISFNMNQYNTVSGSYPSGIKKGKVSTASYQAWLATFNSSGNYFQSNMQSFAQRYTQANNNFDILNKMLSGAISTLADSARQLLRSLT